MGNVTLMGLLSIVLSGLLTDNFQDLWELARF